MKQLQGTDFPIKDFTYLKNGPLLRPLTILTLYEVR